MSIVSQVLHPTVSGGSVPVFGFGRDGNDNTGAKLYRCLAPLLVPATAGNADEHLNSFVMNVSVVATTRFKRYIYHAPLVSLHRSEITQPYEVFGIARVRLANGIGCVCLKFFFGLYV